MPRASATGSSAKISIVCWRESNEAGFPLTPRFSGHDERCKTSRLGVPDRSNQSRNRLRPIIPRRLDSLSGDRCLAMRRYLGHLLGGRRGLATWRGCGRLCLGAAGLYLVAASDE